MATNGYPYEDLVRTSAGRTRKDPEYELIDAMGDTFAKGHYWDVTFECTTGVNASGSCGRLLLLICTC